MTGRYLFLTGRKIKGTNLVRGIVIPWDRHLWPELRHWIIDFDLGASDGPIPHHGFIYVTFWGNFFGPGKDDVLTVKLWRQFK